MVNITPDAVNDISTYYYNVMRKYPNTWEITDVYHQIDKVIDAIQYESDKIIKMLNLNIHGIVKSPLLKKLQTNGMVEAYAKTVQWQFTLRYDNRVNEFFVDNAIKGNNMSNRAYRNGSSELQASLSNDERTSQDKMWESQRTPIFERRIRCIIADTVRQVLSESFTTRRLGKYTVVSGDNKPHSVEGLEQYGNTLYDVAMYHSKNETLCLFSIGKNSHKFICCKLEYDKKYGTWLGFTPINCYDVPTLIKQDAKENLVKV